jgi:DNA mismatch endonuclease (patch repair protein)
MTDTLSARERSERMSRIKSQDTKPELQLRRQLHKQGFRFRKNVRNLPGSPDIVLSKYRTAIFVHGCFWHRHRNCSVASTPKSNTKFWLQKFQTNCERDLKNQRKLRRLGWSVLTVWECELKTKDRLARTSEAIRCRINKRTHLHLRQQIAAKATSTIEPVGKQQQGETETLGWKGRRAARLPTAPPSSDGNAVHARP